MQQLDIFDQAPLIPDTLKKAKVASKRDILKVQTAIMYSNYTTPLEKIKAADLICKIEGYYAPKEVNAKLEAGLTKRIEKIKLIAADDSWDKTTT